MDAVEAFACVMAKEMVSKVLSLVADEVTLAWGFKDELKRLERSLEMVQALLFDAAENGKSQLEPVGIWLKKLIPVAYDADAVFDELTYETLRRKVCDQSSPSENPISFCLRMSHKIRSINESLDEIYKEVTKIGLIRLVGATDHDTTIEYSEIQMTRAYLEEWTVHGGDSNELGIVEMLCHSESEEHLSVLAIVGIGGLGKTMLAKMVYKNDKVMRHFEERIWVCVSDDFDILRLLNDMVQSLTGKNLQSSNVDGIIKNELGGRLKGKRYLLVLDDVWNEDQDKWDCFSNALLGINGSSGSRIMVTTRSRQVVSTMQTSHSHLLGGLSEENSWLMFVSRAFAEGGAVATESLVVIGRKMVNKCRGVPLAIKALGGLLYFKKSEAEWLSILRSELWDLENKILPSLVLSYEHLPSSLKHCFAFCSIIAKDFDLQKCMLIQLWMALGFLRLPKNSDLLMEYLGNKYFNILFLRSFLHDANKDEYNSITSCRMHDLVHDLALAIAKKYRSTLDASQLDDVADVVHLFWSSSLREIPKTAMKICSRLQTLILKGGLDGKLLANFKCLRVLVLDDYSIKELPDSIEKLKHLRYLDISKTNILSLPNSITKLYHLQTLRLRQVHEVPKNFGNLINLRHFCIGENWEHAGYMVYADCMLIGIGRMTYLQTLPFFVVNRDRGCHIKELGSLKNLGGSLTIFGLEHVENSREAKDADLSSKSQLHTLRLCWVEAMLQEMRLLQFRNDERSNNKVCNDEDVFEGLEPHSNLKCLMIENFAGGKFPSWMVERQPSSVLCNLVKIRLCNCNGSEQIPPLGHLQYLKVVEISGMDNVKVIGAEFYGKHSAGGGGANRSSGVAEVTMFPALRKLTLKQMPRLEKWLESEHSMSVFPFLEKLNIGECSSLITVPSHFPSLRELIISGCPNLINIPRLPCIREVSISGCTHLIGLPSLTQVFPLHDGNFILEIVMS